MGPGLGPGEGGRHEHCHWLCHWLLCLLCQCQCQCSTQGQSQAAVPPAGGGPQRDPHGTLVHASSRSRLGEWCGNSPSKKPLTIKASSCIGVMVAGRF
jgi:hypothetical protein